jgi:dTDP-4-dehydrorhamnose 3,5-epimerase
VVELERREDDRGFFARAYCEDEFRDQGLADRMVQANVSFNHRTGTVRGLHMQKPPHGEAKLVRVIRGSVFDVAVDMRPGSRTRHEWFGIELSAENRLALFVPEGCAHGYQTLEPSSEVLYLVSSRYVAGAEQGFRPDDPALSITWPRPWSSISEKDASWPLIGA